VDTKTNQMETVVTITTMVGSTSCRM